MAINDCSKYVILIQLKLNHLVIEEFSIYSIYTSGTVAMLLYITNQLLKGFLIQALLAIKKSNRPYKVNPSIHSVSKPFLMYH